MSRKALTGAWRALAASLVVAAPAPAPAQIAETELALSESFSGVVYAVTGEDVVYAKAFGYADWERRQPNTPDRAFRIGSITKTFTAALLYDLAETKAVSLADPIDRYVAGIPNGGEITLQMLVEHRSGLRDWSQREWKALLLPDRVLTDGDIVDMIRAKSPRRRPDRKTEYNNLGYVLLGLAIEAATGRKYPDLLRERLLEPLSLTGTGAVALDAGIPNLSRGYGPKYAEDRHRYDHHAIRAAGAMHSTAPDLASWCKALQDPDSLPIDYRTTLPGWKTGSRFGHRAFWHTGNTNTYSSLLVLFPEIRGCYVVLSNIGREKPPKALMRTLPEALFGSTQAAAVGRAGDADVR